MSSHTLPERDEGVSLDLVGRLWAGLSERGVGGRARVGAGVRVGLSAGALCICLAVLFLILGMVEVSRKRGVDEEHVFGGLAVAGLVWAVLLYWIWVGYRPWRRLLRTALLCLVTWIVSGGAIALVATFAPRSEMLLGAVVCLGLGITVALVTLAIWDARRARGAPSADVPVRVQCPGCGYSMSGLESSVCPECGRRFTLEALIRAQEYWTGEEIRGLKEIGGAGAKVDMST